MIKSSKQMGLTELFDQSSSRRVKHDLQSRSFEWKEGKDEEQMAAL
jgi:hypothetical protein